MREALRILEAESLIRIRKDAKKGPEVLSPRVDVVARMIGVLLQRRGVTKRDSVKEHIGCTPGLGLVNTEIDAICYEPDPTFTPALTISSSTDPIEGVVIPAPAPPTTPVVARLGTFVP